MSEDKPYETPPSKSDRWFSKYGLGQKPKKTQREIMIETPPQQLKNKSKDVVFDVAWDLLKFGDCPVCHGDPEACPMPELPMSGCKTRRNAIKHMMRPKGKERDMIRQIKPQN